MVSSLDRKIAKGTGWDKSPSREFFFDVIELIQRTNLDFLRQNPGAVTDPAFNVNQFKKSIAQEMMYYTARTGGSPIVWKTTATRMTRNLFAAALFDVRDTGISHGGAVIAAIDQQGIQPGFLTKEEEQYISDRVVRDIFGATCTGLSANSSGLAGILMRMQLFCVERHLRTNKGSMVGFDQNAFLSLPIGNTLLTFDIFFSGPEARKNFLNTVMKGRLNGKKDTKQAWKITKKVLGGISMEPLRQKMTPQKIAIWNKMITASDDEWEITQAGYIPDETGENPVPIITMYDVGADATSQESLCHQGFFIEAVRFYRKRGCVTRSFMDMLLEARKLWQNSRKEYFLNPNVVLADLRKMISAIIPRQDDASMTSRTNDEFFSSIFVPKSNP